jgi:hypothetical protein
MGVLSHHHRVGSKLIRKSDFSHGLLNKGADETKVRSRGEPTDDEGLQRADQFQIR